MPKIRSTIGRCVSAARRLLQIVVLAGALAACSTVPDQHNDPLEPVNRHIFAANQAVDTMLVRPVAVVYRDLMPKPFKMIIGNVLTHVTLPLTFIHDLLQGKPEDAKIALGRFFINSTAGIGGLFDIATPAGFPLHREDMGQTLAVHGAEDGPYIVLPLLGPSSVRDATGTLLDFLIDPVAWATYGSNASTVIGPGRAIVNGVVEREKLIEPLDALRDSVDYYAAVRSAYRQRRELQIRDGKAKPQKEEDDPFASFETEDDEDDKPAPQ